MNSVVKLDLNTLVNPPKTDSISGRKFGEDYCRKVDLLKVFQEGNVIEINVDDNVVKAINDSFIKGMFSELFKTTKNSENIKKQIKIVGSDFYRNLFEKNWHILEAVNNV